MLRTRGAGPILGDTFKRLTGNEVLHHSPNADLGGLWNKIAGEGIGNTTLQGLPAGYVTPVDAVEPGLYSVGRASGFYSLASGAGLTDCAASLEFRYGGTTPSVVAGSPAQIDLWPKAPNASVGMWVRFSPGPSQSLSILSYDGSATTLHASAGIASTLASGLYAGQQHRLHVRVLGSRLDAWLATGPFAASPVVSASAAFFAAAGHPQLRAANPSAAELSTALLLDKIAVNRVGATAADTLASATFRFESHPERRAYQGNASIFEADRSADFRGEHPRLIAVGSPGPSGPQRVVVLQGEVDNFLGNDLIGVQLHVVDRFKFLR